MALIDISATEEKIKSCWKSNLILESSTLILS